MSNRIKAEKKERYDKVFNVQYHPRHHTDLQPFDLSKNGESSLAKRHSQRVDEIAAKELAHCTFQPDTLERSNKQAIKRLLQA